MKTPPAFLFALTLLTPAADAAEGLVAPESAHSVSVTVDRLEHALREKGLTVFACIDPAALAGRHDMQGCDPVLDNVTQVPATFAHIAVAP